MSYTKAKQCEENSVFATNEKEFLNSNNDRSDDMQNNEISAISEARIRRMGCRTSFVKEIKRLEFNDYTLVEEKLLENHETNVITDEKLRNRIENGSQRFMKMVQQRKQSENLM